MGAQARIRNSRREFARTFPQVAQAVQDASIKRQKMVMRIVWVRNAICALAFAAAAVGVIAVRACVQ